jgi:hypothetical protein
LKKAKRVTKDPKIGIGGAPTRATTLPDEADKRKTFPVASGVLDYFPDAIVAVANLSWIGNEQHNPGEALHWARSKSGDEADTMMRHFMQRGTLDTDGVRHSVKMAWRALAVLQKEIESENSRGSKRVRRMSVKKSKSSSNVRRTANRGRARSRNRKRS